MKKRIVAGILALAMMVGLCACGNKDIWDTNFTYNKAIIAWPDGTTKTVEVKQWKDYEGEQIQIIAKDGTVYLVSSYNCILIKGE